VRLSSPVSSVRRTEQGVLINSPHGEERFDSVIFATHAPQTLAMLADASQKNATSCPPCATSPIPRCCMAMPAATQAAQNLVGLELPGRNRPAQPACGVCQLSAQCLATAAGQPAGHRHPQPLRDPDRNLEYARFVYEHPLFDNAAIAAQARLPLLQGKRNSWFAGAWTGYGFHEDGLKSALRVAQDFVTLPEWAR
jgi:hypothetical protein